MHYYLLKCNRKPKHEIFINSALKTPVKVLLSFFKMNMQSMISKLTASGPQGLLKQFIFTSDIKGEMNISSLKKSSNLCISVYGLALVWFFFFGSLCTNSKI